MSAKEILNDIINDFDIQKFSRFFREKSRKFRPIEQELNQYNNDDFSDGTMLGEIDLDDNSEIIICAFKVNKELTERSGKKAQYILGKKILKETARYAAGIFIFYDENTNFRFSLIYDIPKPGAKRDWSNFRRFTYFVSKELTNKTFLIQMEAVDFSLLDKIIDSFSVEKVTKEFYQEIANWYFWAVKETNFPKDAEREDNGRNISVIRLITRLIFIWFMRQRNLVPNNLFDKEFIESILNDTSSESTSYYKAILQNLFFATLNTKGKNRKFRFEKSFQGKNQDYFDQSVYRYEKYFNNKKDMLSIFKEIPFLNGGLFDCLDRRIKEDGKYKEIRIDGFSDKDVGLSVQNFLFFNEEIELDLNEEYGTRNKKYRTEGLINILKSYNFTIDENDPNDQEVALDPELLGKVFENLLASFNPETSTTARKATGSYYTPREIVEYMVSQSLKEYFKTHLKEIDGLNEKLEILFSNNSENENHNPFNKNETKNLVRLIDNLRIVDPAVGSGAFPMGILNKLVFLLSKLDPQNEIWKEAQINAVEKNITDPSLKLKLIEQVELNFKDKNSNYGRKLYLIQNCIYGVDIQQIAVEIAKLRFFISLLVDENIDKSKENWGIEPLPNLDFKLMQGNSLISNYAGIKLIDEKFFQKSETKDEILEELKLRQKDLEKELISLHNSNKLTDLKKKELENKQYKIIKVIKNYSAKTTDVNDDVGLFGKSEYQEKASELLELQKKYFITDIKNERNKLKNEIEKLCWELIVETLKEQNKQDKINEVNKLMKSNTKPFFLWKLYFAEVFQSDKEGGPVRHSDNEGGFDIVIGNPPYIKEYTMRDAFNDLRNSPYYKGKMDIWYFFTCYGIDLLKKNGILTFIAQNNWVTSYGATIMRNKVLKETKMLNIIDFGDYKIFETSGIQTMIMVFRKGNSSNKYFLDYRKLNYTKKVIFQDVLDILAKIENPNIEYLKPEISSEKYIDKSITFGNNLVEMILDKVAEKRNFQLDEKQEVAQGIVYPQDFLNRKNQKVLEYKYDIGAGIFVLCDHEKEKLHMFKKELELIKPLYTINELSKYYGIPKNKFWVIYTKSSFKNREEMNKYPNIKKHLDQFTSVITSDNRPYGLHRAREERFFKGEKIISIRKCAEPTFTYTDFNCYVSATFYVIKTNRINQKYLTSLLNSKLIAFWLKHKGKMQGNNYQIDKEPLLNIPIIKPSNSAQQPLIKIVDKILAKKEKEEDTTELEREIDQMVYEFYGLIEEEMAVVEGK